MGVTFDERLTTAGFVKGSSVIPFLGESEFDSRWRSANPHFLFITVFLIEHSTFGLTN